MDDDLEADGPPGQVTALRGLRRARLIVLAECVVLAGLAVFVVW